MEAPLDGSRRQLTEANNTFIADFSKWLIYIQHRAASLGLRKEREQNNRSDLAQAGSLGRSKWLIGILSIDRIYTANGFSRRPSRRKSFVIVQIAWFVALARNHEDAFLRFG
jgi:hypothetical protein